MLPPSVTHNEFDGQATELSAGSDGGNVAVFQAEAPPVGLVVANRRPKPPTATHVVVPGAHETSPSDLDSAPGASTVWVWTADTPSLPSTTWSNPHGP